MPPAVEPGDPPMSIQRIMIVLPLPLSVITDWWMQKAKSPEFPHLKQEKPGEREKDQDGGSDQYDLALETVPAEMYAVHPDVVPDQKTDATDCDQQDYDHIYESVLRKSRHGRKWDAFSQQIKSRITES